MSDKRSIKITARIMALPESEVHTLLDGVRAEFGGRQQRIDEFLHRRFEEVSPYLLKGQILSEDRSCCWAGISLTSIRSRLPRCSIPQWCRTRISRAFRRLIAFHPELTRHGEGHVSSIAFRSGILEPTASSRWTFLSLQPRADASAELDV